MSRGGTTGCAARAGEVCRWRRVPARYWTCPSPKRAMESFLWSRSTGALSTILLLLPIPRRNVVHQVSIFIGLATQQSRKAKENIIFFVAQCSTLLSTELAEGPTGLRRLAAARCSLMELSQIQLCYLPFDV